VATGSFDSIRSAKTPVESFDLLPSAFPTVIKGGASFAGESMEKAPSDHGKTADYYSML
jgi:hypothetical protein